MVFIGCMHLPTQLSLTGTQGTPALPPGTYTHHCLSVKWVKFGIHGSICFPHVHKQCGWRSRPHYVIVFWHRRLRRCRGARIGAADNCLQRWSNQNFPIRLRNWSLDQLLMSRNGHRWIQIQTVPAELARSIYGQLKAFKVLSPKANILSFCSLPILSDGCIIHFLFQVCFFFPFGDLASKSVF